MMAMFRDMFKSPEDQLADAEDEVRAARLMADARYSTARAKLQASQRALNAAVKADPYGETGHLALARDVRTGERQVKAVERDISQLSKHASVLEIARQSALTEKTLRAAVRMRNSAGGQSVHRQAERFGEQATEAAKVVDAVDVALKMNEDDEDDESESDLSDLIASSPEEDTFNHASLHSKWLRENDEKIHLPVRKKEAIPSVRRPQYRYQDLVSTKIAHPRGMNVKAVSSKAVKATSSKPLPTKTSPVEPVAAPIQRKAEAKPRVRKYPHRKSSVSSSTDVEVRIGARLLGSKGATGGFLFIAKPPVEKLQRIVEIDEAKLVAESKAASGQRLCGARRFVFGAGVDQ